MARYEHLPIYKQAMDIAVYFEQTVAGFSRYHKYTLGTELRHQSKQIVSQIVKANQTSNKQPLLLALRQMLDELIITVRLAKEVKAFKNFNSWHYCIEQITQVSRQNEGWLKSLRKTSQLAYSGKS
jgi:hypothetical protein